jgi:hypothetical protein
MGRCRLPEAGGTLAGVAAPTAKAAAPLSRKRRFLVWSLVVLASILALVAIMTTWVKRQMLDNTAWNKATTQVIQDPKVQSAIATYTINTLYDNIDVGKALSQRLPPQLKQLGPPLAGALEQPATNAVARLLQRPRVQALFVKSSSLAHQKLVNVLENKTGYGISTGNGEVTLNIRTFIIEIGTELGLPQGALAKLPGTAGDITLMKSDQLSAAQTGVQAIRRLSAWLLAGVLVLYGLAIYLARGTRRETLRNSGFALALVGILVLVVRRLLGNYVISSLASPNYQPATHRLWLIGTSILGQIGAAALLYGLVAALGAILAGPSQPATWLRSKIAPILNERPEIAWSAVAFVYLLLILWGGTHALRTWWGILLLGGLIAAGVVALRRETLREFPQTAAAGAPAPAGAGGETELERLAALHEAGTLSDAEYEAAKKSAQT